MCDMSIVALCCHAGHAGNGMMHACRQWNSGTISDHTHTFWTKFSSTMTKTGHKLDVFESSLDGPSVVVGVVGEWSKIRVWPEQDTILDGIYLWSSV